LHLKAHNDFNCKIWIKLQNLKEERF